MSITQASFLSGRITSRVPNVTSSIATFPFWIFTVSRRTISLARPTVSRDLSFARRSTTTPSVWTSRARTMRTLLIAKRLDGVEPRRAQCRHESGDRADKDREENGAGRQPRGHVEDVHVGRDVHEVMRREVENRTVRGTEPETHETSDQPDGGRLKKIYGADRSVTGAERFHDADFPRAFKHRHRHRVGDSENRH